MARIKFEINADEAEIREVKDTLLTLVDRFERVAKDTPSKQVKMIVSERVKKLTSFVNKLPQ